MTETEWSKYVAHAEGKRRTLSVIAATLMLLSVLLAMVLIVKNAHHDCSGLNCTVCAQTASAFQRLANCGGEQILLVSALLTIFCCPVSIPLPPSPVYRITLVTLKVELLN